MTDPTELKVKALDAIRTGFPEGAPPGPDEAMNHHCPECTETSEIFATKPWTAITPEQLIGNPAPSLLTAPAFRYYLPAMMVCSIQAPEALDCFPDSVVALLSPPRGGMSESKAERLAGFNADQALGILAFLQFHAYFKRMAEYGEEAAEAYTDSPVDKVLMRAIEYWSTRA